MSTSPVDSKPDAVLVVMNNSRVNDAFGVFDHNAVNIVAAVMNGSNGSVAAIADRRIPILKFNSIERLLEYRDKLLWLLHGASANVNSFWKFAKFLIDEGVPRDNIINCSLQTHFSQVWIANLQYAARHPVECISTGISYTEVGLDFNQLVGVRGVNLACSNQDLRQGYLSARHVLERNPSIKLVLIGLAPYSFRYDNRKAFAICPRNIQYLFSLDLPPDSDNDQVLIRMLNPMFRRAIAAIPEQAADPIYNRMRATVNRDYAVEDFAKWNAELDNLIKNFHEDTVEENLKILEDYIKLCLDHGAKPIGLVFPFAPIIRRHFPRELIVNFRQMLRMFERAYDFRVIDLFDMPLGYDCFYNLVHLNMHGASLASARINIALNELDVLSSRTGGGWKGVSYAQLSQLSKNMHKDDFNQMIDNIFSRTIKHLRSKSKLRVGFVGYDASMWCGDYLYRLFERSERYETTVYLCRRRDQFNNPTVVKDFHHGVDQLRSRGINVVGVEGDIDLPHQDILIFLTPYVGVLPRAFQLGSITLETLTCYITYTMETIEWSNTSYLLPIIHLSWKAFFENVAVLKNSNKNSRLGMPRGEFSGHPKLDYFYVEHPTEFEWKMARPDATKIIWAPHWSIDSTIMYSTFHWNYQFMYDYARTHPETSWVVKPHPNLLFSAVKAGVFPSTEAFEDYLRRWDELPNARVVTGGYYQPIFASSDGMILDSSSFILEYQYTHKPMLFLTRDTQKFNAKTQELMQSLYRTDGKNFGGIAQFIEQILLKRYDPLAGARRQFFDKHLDYRRRNEMLASEYIFRSIDDALTE